MAKLRKWCAYRTLERPYTRFSKFRKKGFVKSRPGKKIIKFDMGNLVKGPDAFPIKLRLISKLSLLLVFTKLFKRKELRELKSFSL